MNVSGSNISLGAEIFKEVGAKFLLASLFIFHIHISGTFTLFPNREALLTLFTDRRHWSGSIYRCKKTKQKTYPLAIMTQLEILEFFAVFLWIWTQNFQCLFPKLHHFRHMFRLTHFRCCSYPIIQFQLAVIATKSRCRRTLTNHVFNKAQICKETVHDFYPVEQQ